MSTWQLPLDTQHQPRVTREQILVTMEQMRERLYWGAAHVPVPSSKRLAPRWQVPAIKRRKAGV